MAKKDSVWVRREREKVQTARCTCSTGDVAEAAATDDWTMSAAARPRVARLRSSDSASRPASEEVWPKREVATAAGTLNSGDDATSCCAVGSEGTHHPFCTPCVNAPPSAGVSEAHATVRRE
eukprot:6190182-Pleurochrysis_carterae.AAC.2